MEPCQECECIALLWETEELWSIFNFPKWDFMNSPNVDEVGMATSNFHMFDHSL